MGKDSIVKLSDNLENTTTTHSKKQNYCVGKKNFPEKIIKKE